ncbi:MAG TPA: hypothetical protein VIJ51_15120 [Solirubrobacteraceae bacterium]
MARSSRRTFVVVVAGVFGAGIGGAVLVSAASTGSITACVNNQPNAGTMRVTSDPSGFSGSACNSFEHALTFNAAGPAGPAGPPGPAGAAGATGPTGSQGASGAGGGSTSTKAVGTNFIAITSFPMPGRHFVEAQVDCPKGDVGQGGTAAMISPLGVSPAVGNADAGPGITSPGGHPAVGWTGEATNSSSQAASLKLSVICSGPDLDATHVTRKLDLSRALRKTKAKKP